MLKSDFLAKVSTMANPVIEEFSPGRWSDLMATCWIIRDSKNVHNKFCTPAVQLTTSEYRKRNHSGFYARESHFRNLYHRWLSSHLTQRALDASPQSGQASKGY